jgi:hypothetical protein
MPFVQSLVQEERDNFASFEEDADARWSTTLWPATASRC